MCFHISSGDWFSAERWDFCRILSSSLIDRAKFRFFHFKSNSFKSFTFMLSSCFTMLALRYLFCVMNFLTQYRTSGFILLLQLYLLLLALNWVQEYQVLRSRLYEQNRANSMVDCCTSRKFSYVLHLLASFVDLFISSSSLSYLTSLFDL